MGLMKDKRMNALGKAADEKHKAKQAIKDKKFDKAWKHLNNQKVFYIEHIEFINEVHPHTGFTPLQAQVLISLPHVDMANILRQEDSHLDALSHLSYHYQCLLHSGEVKQTIQNKMKPYFTRAMKNCDFVDFMGKLNSQNILEYTNVQAFIYDYFAKNSD
ncbi:hypothetical protein [Providencia sp.]|uniref:hypothetical protein n=1 Tax=Providencia sp. TaxID=589 RepID=UPI003F967412